MFQITYLSSCMNYIHSLIYLTTLFTVYLLLFFLQNISYPVASVYLFRKINKMYMYVLIAILSYMGEVWCGIRIQLYIDKEFYDNDFGRESALLMANHRVELDWYIMTLLTFKLPLLTDIKSFVKTEIKKIPVLGKSLGFADHILLTRSFDKDEASIKAGLKTLSLYEEPFWLLFFAEGTRYTKERHYHSLEYSAKHNKHRYQYHLLPRVKGFHTAMPLMKNYIKALYNIEIAVVDENDGTIKSIYSASRGTVVHIYVHRIPMDEVPDTTEGREEFLHDLFTEKDRLMDTFTKTSTFWDDISDREPIMMRPSYQIKLITFLSFAALFISNGYFLLYLYNSGKVLLLCGVVLITVTWPIIFRSIVFQTLAIHQTIKESLNSTTCNNNKVDK